MTAAPTKAREAALRREVVAVAKMLRAAAGRMERLEARAREASALDPLPEGDPRAWTFAEEVVGASESGCLAHVRDAARVYLATARTTDRDLKRKKLERDAAEGV
ncbi:MAG: hypothetical protein KJ067_23480 [Vicinamibacteria bacterium]|nr:hypothetical protein [Vicinamibacteria bacterium]